MSVLSGGKLVLQLSLGFVIPKLGSGVQRFFKEYLEGRKHPTRCPGLSGDQQAVCHAYREAATLASINFFAGQAASGAGFIAALSPFMGSSRSIQSTFLHVVPAPSAEPNRLNQR